MYGAETWTLRRKEQKRLEAFEMWIWRRMEHGKWTDKIKNAVVLERVGERRIMLQLIKKRNGKREESPRQKKISDDRQHYDKRIVIRYEKEG